MLGIYLCVHEGSKGKVVEKVGEILPNVRVAVLSETLVVEAVNLRDLSAFVVPSEDGDPLPVSNLCEELHDLRDRSPLRTEQRSGITNNLTQCTRHASVCGQDDRHLPLNTLEG